MNKRQKKKFRNKNFRKKCTHMWSMWRIDKQPGCYLVGTRRAHDVRYKALRKHSIDELAKSYIYKKSEIARLETSVNVKYHPPIEKEVAQFRKTLWNTLPNNLEVLNESRRKHVLNRCKELIEQGHD